MQIVSSGDNLHEMSNLFYGKNNLKKNAINLSSAELPQRVAKVRMILSIKFTNIGTLLHFQYQNALTKKIFIYFIYLIFILYFIFIFIFFIYLFILLLLLLLLLHNFRCM